MLTPTRNHDNGRLDFEEGSWLPKAKSRRLELAGQHGKEGGGGDSEEGGALGHDGAARCRLRTFLLLSLHSFSFLHTVDVGSGFRGEGVI